MSFGRHLTQIFSGSGFAWDSLESSSSPFPLVEIRLSLRDYLLVIVSVHFLIQIRTTLISIFVVVFLIYLHFIN